MFKEIFSDILLDSELTQEEFAKSIGVSQGTVSKWLAGSQEPRYSQLQRICEVFKTDAEYLLGIKDA